MKILITGATGFIGHHLVKRFVEAGHEVFGTYRSKMHNQVDGCTYFHLDLSEDSIPADHFDCVIHAAGQVENGKTWDYVKNSVIATKRLIDFCEENKIEKMIFFSSIAVYGECEGIVNEETKGKNMNTYAQCKILGEKMLSESSIPQRYVLRLSRILGEGGFDNSGFLARFVKQMMNGETVRYSSPNMKYNNLFHVTELASFCELLSEMHENGMMCIGTGTDDPVEMSSLVHILHRELKSKSELREIERNAPLTCHEININKLLSMGFNPRSTEDILIAFAKDAIRERNGNNE